MQQRDICAAKSIYIGNKEVCIFKEQQHTKVKTHGNSKTDFFDSAVASVFFYGIGSKKVHYSTCNHNREVFNFTPGIEDKTCNGYNAVFVFVGYDVIYK